VDSIIDHVTNTPSMFTTLSFLQFMRSVLWWNFLNFFTCNSLTILKFCFISTKTTTSNFPSLKHLFICNCHYFGEINRLKIFTPYLTYLNTSGLRVDEKFDAYCVIELARQDLNILNIEFDAYYVIDLARPTRLKYFKYCDYDLYYFFMRLIFLSWRK